MDDICEEILKIEENDLTEFEDERLGDNPFIEEENKRLKEEICKLEKDLNSSELKNNDLEKEMIDLKKELNDLENVKKELMDKTRDIPKLEDDLKEKTQNISDLEKEVKDLLDKLSKSGEKKLKENPTINMKEFFKEHEAENLEMKRLLLLRNRCFELFKNKQYEKCIKYGEIIQNKMKENNYNDDEEGELYRIIGESYYKLYINDNNINELIKSQENYVIALKYTKNAGNASVLHRISEIYYEGNNFDASLSLLISIINRFPNYNRLNEVIFLCGCILKSKKDYKQSIDYFQHLVNVCPNDFKSSDIWLIIGLCLEESNSNQNVTSYKRYYSNLDERTKELYKNWEDCYNDSRTWMNEGDKLYKNRYFSLAYDFYEESAKRSNCDKEILNEKECLLGTKEHNDKIIEKSYNEIKDEEKKKDLDVEIEKSKNDIKPNFDSKMDDICEEILKIEENDLTEFEDNIALITLDEHDKVIDKYNHTINEMNEKIDSMNEKLKTKEIMVNKTITLNEKLRDDLMKIQEIENILNDNIAEMNNLRNITEDRDRRYNIVGDDMSYLQKEIHRLVRDYHISSKYAEILAYPEPDFRPSPLKISTSHEMLQKYRREYTEKAICDYNNGIIDGAAGTLKLLYENIDCSDRTDVIAAEGYKVLGECFYKMFLKTDNRQFIESSMSAFTGCMYYDKYRDNPEILHRIADLTYQDATYTSTLPLLSDLLLKHPAYEKFYEVMFLAGCVQKYNCDYRQALEYFKPCVNKLPPNVTESEIWFIIGLTYQDMKEPTDVNSVTAFKKCHNALDEYVKPDYETYKEYISSPRIYELHGDKFYSLKYYTLALDFYLKCLIKYDPSRYRNKNNTKENIIYKLCKTALRCEKIDVYERYLKQLMLSKAEIDVQRQEELKVLYKKLVIGQRDALENLPVPTSLTVLLRIIDEDNLRNEMDSNHSHGNFYFPIDPYESVALIREYIDYKNRVLKKLKTQIAEVEKEKSDLEKSSMPKVEYERLKAEYDKLSEESSSKIQELDKNVNQTLSKNLSLLFNLSISEKEMKQLKDDIVELIHLLEKYNIGDLGNIFVKAKGKKAVEDILHIIYLRAMMLYNDNQIRPSTRYLEYVLHRKEICHLNEDKMSELYRVLGESYYKIFKDTNNINYLKQSHQHYLEAYKYRKNTSNPTFLFNMAIVHYEYGLYDDCLRLLDKIRQEFMAYDKLQNVVFLSAVIKKYQKDYETSHNEFASLYYNPPEYITESELYFIKGRMYDECLDDNATDSFIKSYELLEPYEKEKFSDVTDYKYDYEVWEDFGDKYYNMRYFTLALDYYLQTIHYRPLNEEEVYGKICKAAIFCESSEAFNENRVSCIDPDLQNELEELHSARNNPEDISLTLDSDDIEEELISKLLSAESYINEEMEEEISMKKSEYDSKLNKMKSIISENENTIMSYKNEINRLEKERQKQECEYKSKIEDFKKNIKEKEELILLKDKNLCDNGEELQKIKKEREIMMIELDNINRKLTNDLDKEKIINKLEKEKEEQQCDYDKRIEEYKANIKEKEEVLLEKERQLKNINEEYERKKKEKDSEIEELNSEKQLLANELDKEKKKLSDYKMEHSKSTNEEMEELNREITNLSEMIKRRDEKIDEINKRKKSIELQLADRISELTKIIDSLTSSNEEKKNEIEKYKAAINNQEQINHEKEMKKIELLNKIDELKNRITDLENINKDRKNEIERMEKNHKDEREKLIERICNTESARREKENSLNELHGELKRHKSLLESKEKEEEDKNSYYEELLEDNRKLELLVKQLKQEITSIQSENDNVSSETIESLKKEKEKLEKDFTNLQTKYRITLLEKSQLNNQYKSVNNDLNNYKSKLEEMENEKSKKETGNTELINQLKDKINKLESYRNSLINKNNSLEEEIKKLNQKIDELIKTKNMSDNEIIKELRIKIIIITKEKNELIDDVKKLQSNIAELKAKLKETDILSQENKELKTKCLNLQKQIHLLGSSGSISDKKLHELEMLQSKSKVDESEKLLTQLKDLQSKFDKQKKQLDDLQNLNNTYKSNEDNYTKKIQSLEQSLKSKEQKPEVILNVKEVQSKFDEQQKQIIKLQNMNNSLKSNENMYKMKIQSLENTIKNSKDNTKDSKELSEKIERLTSQLDKQQKQIDQLQNNNRIYKTNETILKQKVQLLENSLRASKEKEGESEQNKTEIDKLKNENNMLKNNEKIYKQKIQSLSNTIQITKDNGKDKDSEVLSSPTFKELQKKYDIQQKQVTQLQDFIRIYKSNETIHKQKIQILENSLKETKDKQKEIQEVSKNYSNLKVKYDIQQNQMSQLQTQNKTLKLNEASNKQKIQSLEQTAMVNESKSKETTSIISDYNILKNQFEIQNRQLEQLKTLNNSLKSNENNYISKISKLENSLKEMELNKSVTPLVDRKKYKDDNSDEEDDDDGIPHSIKEKYRQLQIELSKYQEENNLLLNQLSKYKYSLGINKNDANEYKEESNEFLKLVELSYEVIKGMKGKDSSLVNLESQLKEVINKKKNRDLERRQSANAVSPLIRKKKSIM